MARKRMIDPSFWEDEKLGSCEPIARLLFMGLISQADDEGRLKGHPSLLRSAIFPYDYDITNEIMEVWLNTLSGHRLIIRYEIDSQRYILIKNFKKHQTINKPQKSKLPDIPEDYGNTTVVVTEECSNSHVQKKLKEEKLKEVEVKGNLKGTELTITDNETIKNRLLKLINECELKDYTLHDLDIIYSYIGVCDVEVIEACIKKGQKKHVNYTTKTLAGKVKEGITKKEQIIPIVEVGEYDAKKHEGQLQSGSTTTENKSITGGAVGWLPSEARDSCANIVQLHKVSG